MSVTVQYRIRGGEVIKVSLPGQPFNVRDQTYWGKLTDPPRPDGDDAVPPSGPNVGQLRVLGFAKINDAGTVRNATQAEIDGFIVAEAEDEKDQDAEHAVTRALHHNVFGKMFKALALETMDELNILRALHGLPARTKPQLIAAIEARVDRED